MLKRFPLTLFSVIILTIISFLCLSTVKGETDHVVISEVQISGGGTTPADDEFVELYNPTEGVIDISTWSIQVETTGGSFAKKNFVSPVLIPAHGFYLIANNSYDNSVIISPDLSHNSFSLSSTGTTIFLVNNQAFLTTGNEATIVDKVGIGSNALDSEGSPFTPIPSANQSIERKPGVNNPTGGNGLDTNNNASDFDLRTTSEPQNRFSVIEPPFLTPTESPTETPSPTPMETQTPTPTEAPTITPSPTPEETSTPTPTASPTISPTEIPTPTPTISPTVTPIETPIATEAPSPMPTEFPLPTTTPIPTETPTLFPTPSLTPKPHNNPPGWLKSPVFTCSNPHIPTWVYQLMKLLMPWKFNCSL